MTKKKQKYLKCLTIQASSQTIPAMPDLALDVAQRLMANLLEWAKPRRTTIELAAVEMIRIGLHATRDQEQKLPEGLDVTDGETRH
jgi:hypothetical protein